jgi:ribosomal protein L40E
MKGFNSRSAVEEYISTHPLSFSTPDLILKEFVIWLCELVDDPHGKGEEKIPRIILYTSGEEKRGIDSLGSGFKSEKDQAQNNLLRSPATTMETSTNKPSTTFCIECGSKLNSKSKFCNKCGTKQKTN